MAERNFIVGSSFEGAEGMFEQPEEQKSELTEEQYQAAREKKEIIPDIKERFEQTLSENGWELVQDISEDIHYPSIEEWLRFRIEHNRGTKFYPCFVRDANGEVSFVKFQVSTNQNALHGLAQEQHVFAAGIPEIVDSPAMLSDAAPDESQLGYMEFEAIPYEEGQVLKTEDIALEQCDIVAIKINALENYPIDQLPTEYHIPDLLGDKSIQEVFNDELAIITEGLQLLPEDWGVSELFTPEWQQSMNDFASRLSTRKVLVHGDAGRKNIVFSRDGTGVKFVDWELAGIGFLGQDAGKFLNGLNDGSQQRRQFIQTYTNPENQFDSERLHGMFGSVMLETLHSFSYRMARVDQLLKGTDAQLQELKEKIYGYHRSISKKIEEFNSFMPPETTEQE